MKLKCASLNLYFERLHPEKEPKPRFFEKLTLKLKAKNEVLSKKYWSIFRTFLKQLLEHLNNRFCENYNKFSLITYALVKFRVEIEIFSNTF